MAIALTPEQEAIASLPPHARTVVTAAAGTGKTRLVLGRLEALIGEHGIAPGHEILVLSFSRSAVREIRDRLAPAGSHLDLVQAMTFDSFATRLLRLVLPQGQTLNGLDYEQRIELATRVLNGSPPPPSAVEILSPMQHVIVDELQDLVGVRADFVQALVSSVGGGFTLLGDPAQGIYNFSMTSTGPPDAHRAVFDWALKTFSEAQAVTLTENFRAKTEATKSMLWASAALNAPAPDYASIHSRLGSQIGALTSLQDVAKASAHFQQCEGSSAILSRNNGQALLVSRELHASGVAHRLQRSSIARCIDPWVACVLGPAGVPVIPRPLYDELVQKAPYRPSDPGEGWRVLLRAGGANGSLDVPSLCSAFRAGAWFDELSWQMDSPIVVSTVHRAKGLEFERVVLLEEDSHSRTTGSALGEEARILHVATTRPKSELFRIKGPSWRNLELDRDRRWFRTRGKRITDVEIRGEDIDASEPSTSPTQGFDAPSVQNYIANCVRPGDEVSLVHRQSSVLGRIVDLLAVVHDEIEVGVTNGQFGSALWQIIRGKRSGQPFPTEISGLRVEGIDTVTGPSTVTQRTGLGPSGFWLRVRVAGLGELQ